MILTRTPLHSTNTEMSFRIMKPKSAEVDVVILFWDRVELTLKALANARRQVGVKMHIWLVDQGSAPENLRRIREDCAGLTSVTIIEMGRNAGVPGGRNAGMRAGCAPVIVFLDNDAEFDGCDAFRITVERFEREPELAAIGYRVLNYDTGCDQDVDWVYPVALKGRRQEEFYATQFCGAGHALRRAAAHQAGYYDEDLFFIAETLALR